VNNETFLTSLRLYYQIIIFSCYFKNNRATGD